MTGFTVPADHPVLPGHFPNDPLLPGVVLLDHLCTQAEAAFPGRHVAGIDSVKFLRPLRPAETVAFVWAAPQQDRLGFTCLVGTETAARGTLRLA